MIWTESTIRNELIKLQQNLRSNDDVGLVPIIINNKLTKVPARFFFSIENEKFIPLKFEFSSILLNSNFNDLYITNTIKHEYVHFYVSSITKENHAHDKLFKKYASYLQLKPTKEILKNSNDKINFIRTVYKYAIVCTKCNKLLSLRIRKNKKTLDNYLSPCCNCDLEYKIIEMIKDQELLDFAKF